MKQRSVRLSPAAGLCWALSFACAVPPGEPWPANADSKNAVQGAERAPLDEDAQTSDDAPDQKPAKSAKKGPAAKADAAAIERVLALAKSDNRVMDHLRTLTQEIGPRLTGSNHFNHAAQWCQAQFESWGLAAHLEKWGEFPAGFDRGPSHGRMVAPATMDLTFITNAWSVGTQGAVRGAALLEPAKAEEIDAALDHLAGAWILRSRDRIDSKLRNRFNKLCEQAGVAGFVSSGGKSGLLGMFGNQRVDLDKLKQEVEIRLLHEHYDALLERLKKGEKVELEFDVQNEFTPGPVPCYNVVADLEGQEFPHEYVIVGGHLDSWDGAEGAQDNGTGVATTLEAARLIAASGAKPRRTIRFLLFGGEEQGLLGSNRYVKDHADLLAKTSVAFIHDGGANHLTGVRPTYAMLDDFERVFAPLKDFDPARPFEVTEADGLVNSGDSDHAPFIAAGVPGFFWEQSEEGYDRVHHTQYDTLETVDPAEEKHSACVVAVAALGFANLDHLVDRTDTKPVEPRHMGINLDNLTVASISKGGKASDAGWKEGDVIASVDGVKVESRGDVTRLLQKDGPLKTVRLKRGEEVIDSVLDYSADPAEKERRERSVRREAWRKAHKKP